MDASAFVLIAMYLIRFIFITVFQVKTSHDLQDPNKRDKNRIDVFVFVMVSISPVLLNLGYFFYVYEMVHVKVLLEAPN